jgi:hypothetical protein
MQNPCKTPGEVEKYLRMMALFINHNQMSQTSCVHGSLTATIDTKQQVPSSDNVQELMAQGYRFQHRANHVFEIINDQLKIVLENSIRTRY